MIDIETSSLYNEILQVRNDGAKKVFFFWKAIIHTANNDFSDTNKPIKLLNLDISRDYQKNIADEMTVTLMIPMGLWAKQLYPNRASLEISIYKTPLQEGSGNDNESSITAQRYKAMPVLDGLPVLQGKDIDQLNEDTLDLRDLLSVSFQLITKTVDALRMVTIGGIYRNTTVEKAIKGIIAGEVKKVVSDPGSAISAVDMVPANNKTTRDHIVLPHGLRLMDLAPYVQDSCGGVYNAGLNSYIQNRILYIYPIYDNTRLNQAPATVTIIKIPATMSSGSERTYRKTGTDVIILATSDSSFKDDANSNYLTHGNGLRFADAGKYLNNIVETKDNKAVALRKKTLNEFVNVVQDKRNNVQVSDRKINANSFREYSKLAMMNGARYTFSWDNADPDLLTPGMMIKIHYLSEGNIEEINGVLLYTHSAVQLRGVNIQSERHVTTTMCVIFVNKDTKTD